MADNAERVVLEVDDKGLVTAVASANKQVAGLEVSFARAGQTAEQRLLAKIATLQQRMQGDPLALKQLDTLREKVLGKLQADLDKTGGKFQGFAASVKNAIQNPLQAAGTAAEGLLNKLGPVGVGIGIVAGTATLAAKAYASMAKEMGDGAERLLQAGERLGMTTKQVAQFDLALKLTGHDISTLEATFRTLSQLAEDGGKASETVQKLGISIRDSRGEIIPTEQLMLKLADAISGIESPLKRAAVARELFGRAGIETLGILKDLRTNYEYFQKFDAGPSEATANRLHALGNDLEKVSWHLERMKKQAKIAVLFEFEPAIDVLLKIMEWTDRMRGSKLPTPLKMGLATAAAGAEWFNPGAPTVAPPKVVPEAKMGPGSYYLLNGIGNDNSLAGLKSRLNEQTEAYNQARKDALNKARTSEYLMMGTAKELEEDIATKRKAMERTQATIKSLEKAEADAKYMAENMPKLQREIALSQAEWLPTGWDKKEKRYTATSAEEQKRRVSKGAIGSFQEFAQQATIEEGMRLYGMGQVPGDNRLANQDKRAAELQKEREQGWAEQQAADNRTIGSMERQMRLEEQLIRLRTGPGGEMDAIDKAYRLRLDYAKQVYDIESLTIGTVLAGYKRQETEQEAQIERIRQIAELDRQRFDNLKNAAEGLFDAAFTKSQSLGQAFANFAKSIILTPIKEGLSTMVASALKPIMYGSDGRGGIMGRILGVFGQGGINDVKLIGGAVPVIDMTPRIAGSSTSAAGSSLMGAAASLGLGSILASGGRTVGGEVIGAGRAATAGLTQASSGLWQRGGIDVAQTVGGPGGTSGFAGPVTSMGGSVASKYAGALQGAALLGGGMLAMNGLQRGGAVGNAQTIGGGAMMGFGAAGMLGMTGYGGAIFGAGAGLMVSGLQRGGWSGVGMSTGGGALMGMQLGGPVGAAIGAGVGFIAGLIRLGIKGAAEKVQEKVKAIYGLSIDKRMAQQIVQIAKERYNKNLDMAVRAPETRELLRLYAQTMGKPVPAALMADQARSASLIESRGQLYQGAQYDNGQAYTYASSLPSYGGAGSTLPTASPYAGGITVNLNPQQTVDLWRTGTTQAIAGNPRAVSQSALRGSAASSTRTSNAMLTLQPSAITI